MNRYGRNRILYTPKSTVHNTPNHSRLPPCIILRGNRVWFTATLDHNVCLPLFLSDIFRQVSDAPNQSVSVIYLFHVILFLFEASCPPDSPFVPFLEPMRPSWISQLLMRQYNINLWQQRHDVAENGNGSERTSVVRTTTNTATSHTHLSMLCVDGGAILW